MGRINEIGFFGFIFSLKPAIFEQISTMRFRIILLVMAFLTKAMVSFGYQSGPGRALKLNGANFAEAQEGFDDVTFPITLEAWVKLNNINDYAFPIFVSHHDLTNIYQGFWAHIWPERNLIVAGFGDGIGGNNPAYRQSVVVEYDLLEKQWMHLAFTIRSARDMDIHVDGMLLPKRYSGTGRYQISIDPLAKPSIGFWHNNNLDLYADGEIDEVRYWGVSRSSQEIREFMCKRIDPKEPDLLGYWTMDEISGGLIVDQTSSGRDFKLLRNASLVTSGAAIGDKSFFEYSANQSLASFDASWEVPNQKINLSVAKAHGFQMYLIEPGDSGNCSIGEILGIFIPRINGSDTIHEVTFDEDLELRTRYSNASPWDQNVTFLANIETQILLRRWEGQVPTGIMPDVTLPNELFVCGDTLVELQAMTEDSSIVWSTGGTGKAILATQSGTYWVAVSNECGTDTAYATVAFSDTPEVNISSRLIEDCIFPYYILEASVNLADYELVWNTGSQEETIGVVSSDSYVVSVSNECGMSHAMIEVDVPAPDLGTLPNVFTPNGDGINDTFEIPSNLEGATFKVFNRWGELVKELINYHSGTWDGGNLPEGVYLVLAEDSCSTGIVKYPVYITR